MKNSFTISLVIFLLLPFLSSAQKGKLFKETTISASSAINYYPTMDTYSWIDDYLTNDRDLILDYSSSNSGTFVVEITDSIPVERERYNNLPSQLLGIGVSVRFAKENQMFHELSLTKLSFAKSSYELYFTMQDSLGENRFIRVGHRQKATALGFRYEFGKMFGDSKNSRVRFGLSGGIEPSFYFFKRTPLTSVEFPVSARIMTIDATIIPMLEVRLSKRVSMDFKVVSSVLLQTFGSVREQNPNRTTKQQAGDRDYTFPEFNFGYSLAVRYTLKEAVISKKKNRKRKRRRRR